MTTTAARLVKRVLPELKLAIASENLAQATAHAEKALAILRESGARKARIPRPPAPGASREERRAVRIDARVELRKLCDARADGTCEVCGRDNFRLEMDHLVSGSVRKEDPTAALMACPDCHRAKHRNDVATLRAYKEACIRLFLAAGLREIERRLRKVEGPRHVPSVPVKIEVR